jgi:hypothetical protein
MTLGELASVPPEVRFPIGLVAAVVAVLAMDLLMRQVPEGTTPPYVAASVLTRTAVDEAPDRLASVAHYLAGLGTGLLFVYLLYATERLLGGSSPVSVAAGALVLYVLMVAFFLIVPLPRAVGIDGQRRSAIGRGWAVVAAGYLAVLVPVSVALTLAVA